MVCILSLIVQGNMKFNINIFWYMMCFLLQGSLIETLKETNPSSHMGVPRVWEKIMEKIQEAVSHCAYIKKKLLTWGMSVGLAANQRFIVR